MIEPTDANKYWMCLRKHRYPTYNGAKKALKRRKAHKTPSRKPFVRSYHCPHCDGWHLTSKEAITAEQGMKS